jgi:hypothetical protein
VLSAPVHLRRLSDGSSLEADTIYVSQDPAAAATGRSDPFHLLVPAADQPDNDQMSIGGTDYHFKRRPSVPLVFDEVEVVR